MRPIFAIYILLFTTTNLLAQGGILSKRVAFEYTNIRLKEALADLTERYQIPFSYSTEQVNVRQRITAKVVDAPLSTALDKLFENVNVGYMLVGNHIVLKNDPGKAIGRSKGSKQGNIKKRTPEPQPEQTVVLVKQEETTTEQQPQPPPQDSVLALQMPNVQPIRHDGDMHPFDETLLNFEKWRYQSDTWIRRPPNEKRIAQVSVLPFIGTNTRQSDDVTNNVSLNLLWGLNGGVDGMEVGVGLNMIRTDMKGFQVAGLGNKVGRNMTGTQRSRGSSKWQAAGAFNLSRGNTKFQVSGVFNSANDVEIGQFSILFNRSRGEMKGLQIGLINISDTVSGVPIGLINIVKRGYNKFEIYGSEILHGNFQLKLGANAFYNIFHVGARVPPGDGSYQWGLGYGIGTVTTLSPKSTLNWELMAIHISENETWTNTLNSIGQFRWLWNHQLGKSIGFFIGPTANVMISQLRNSETGEIRSPVVPYTLLDEDLNGKTNLKAWVGVNAGFRF
ncbi:MAG: STN domain-containing protein [Saprospiraceae bacterium]|nr:STN domain-containing protein [Saprospiraceae bacterium]